MSLSLSIASAFTLDILNIWTYILLLCMCIVCRKLILLIFGLKYPINIYISNAFLNYL